MKYNFSSTNHIH